MAPNNALKKATAATTTVLQSGTVEARGMGTKATSRDVISQEIVAFLEGEAKLSITAESRAFFTVWTFITRLPGPTWVDHHPGYLMRGMAYFPMAGSLVGLFVGVFFDFTNITLGLPSIIAGALSTAASLWITGCFHEDGLADASDGIGGGWSRSQILRIMSDTRLGTYGCAVLMLYLVTKLELLAALGSSEWSFQNCRGAAPALLLSHSFARLTSPYLIRTNDYTDEGGPKFAFYGFMLQAKYLVTWWRVAFAALTCISLGFALVGLSQTLTLLLGMGFVAHIAGRYANYLLGGVMGDYLGATICVSEIVVLTLLLITDSVASLMTSALEDVLTMERAEQLSILWENPKLAVLARFVAVIFATSLWSRLVGPPDVFVRETVVANIEKNDGEIRIGLNVASVDEAPTTETSRSKAETICRNEGSTFHDRYEAVSSYLDSLAKPLGSLGTLEEWAARLGALQKTTQPRIETVACLIFAADHGIAKKSDEGGEGCSAYPQVVTQGVLRGLDMGIAGASVLAASNGVKLRVVDAGVVGEPVFNGGVVVQSSFKLKGGTRNSCTESAMTVEEVEQLIVAGRLSMKEFVNETSADLLCLGEVGIGNTTTSSILLAAITREDPEKLVDGGASLAREVDQGLVCKKIGIVKKALSNHSSSTGPAEGMASMLAKFGGAEIATLVGAILQASEQNMPVVVDGFIVTVAALVASLISPSSIRVMFFATQSAEKGQAVALQKIRDISMQSGIPVPAVPALSMQLRMGEATAALIAVPLLRCACKVLCEMATLQQIIGDES
ncbi:phosphoribosyltransferase [Fragilaria crotonensis]|nr:phosphoribosyltransferase [Fragilaria crotonensis]